jgi:hypothetical protein
MKANSKSRKLCFISFSVALDDATQWSPRSMSRLLARPAEKKLVILNWILKLQNGTCRETHHRTAMSETLDDFEDWLETTN